MKNTTLIIALLFISIVKPLSAHIQHLSITDSLLSASAYIDRGERKYDNNDLEGAITEYSKAIKLEPNNAYAYVLKGQSLSQLYRYDEALLDINKSIELDSTYFFPYSERARIKHAKEDYKGSIIDCTISIKLEPNYAGVFVQRANSKHELGDYNGAISDYSKALEIDPEYIYAYANRAKSKGYLGNYKEGIIDCDKAISIDTEYSYAYYQRGNIKYYAKDYTGSIADLSKAIKLFPDYAKAYLVRGESKFELEDYRGALLDFTESTRLRPTAYSYKMLGEANVKLDKQEEAIRNYDKAIELYPNYIDALLLRGSCKADLGNFTGAEKDFLKGIEIDKENGLAYYYLANIYSGEKAVYNYTKSLESFPNYEYTYFYRALVYIDINKYDEAISDLKQVMMLNSSLSSKCQEKIGDIYFGQKKYEEAIVEYTKAVKTNNKRLVLYFQIARAKSAMGNEEASIKEYKKLLKYEKDYPNPNMFLWVTVYNNIGYNYMLVKNLKQSEKYLMKALEINSDEEYLWGTLSKLYYMKGDYKKCFDSANKSISIYKDGSSIAKNEIPGFPYYYRALASIKLNQNKEQSCLDLSKAGELGYDKAYEAIKEHCNK